MRIKLALLVLITSIFISPAFGQEKADFSELTMTGEAQVGQIIDPLRLRLLDGRIIQLAGIDIPDLTPYDTGDIGLAAMALMREKLIDKHIKIYQSKDHGAARTNRMGYHLAHIAEKNSGEWIQGLFLEKGLARIRPSSVNIEMAAQMKEREDMARGQKTGLWENPEYKTLSPEEAETAMNGWAIVEGRVRASAMANNTIFLNFGHDWRTDFTIGIPSAVRRKLADTGMAPLELANKNIRVRGWIENYNGPYIELMAPVWIEVLPEPSEGATLPTGNN